LNQWGWKPKDWLSLSLKERGLVIAGIDIHAEEQKRLQDELEAKSR